MTRYILANWKANKTLAEAESWLERFCRLYTAHPQVKVILAPPTLHLQALHQKIAAWPGCPLSLAAQDLSPFPSGSYTGATTAAMVRGLVEYAILGHSERRRYFHETDREVAQKVSEARAAGITPILCVDLPYARTQIAALQEDDRGSLLIGYGPVAAIGRSHPPSPAETQRALTEIRRSAPHSPLLYGGSVHSNNAASFFNLAELSGLMVGTASLEPEEFACICKMASEI